MSTQHGQPADTVTKIRKLLPCFPEVEKAVLYGSRAKGNASSGSDIDLTLLGSRLNQRMVGQIEDALDDLLLPYRFDLSIFARIKDADLLEQITSAGVAFCEKTSVDAKY